MGIWWMCATVDSFISVLFLFFALTYAYNFLLIAEMDN